jgi:DNA integrity scanning protein DisA with diadenylate cyclase activity
MNKLLIERLDKIYEDIVKDYVHNDNVDDDISEILSMIDNLQNKIEWTL